MPRKSKDWITEYVGFIAPAGESPLAYHVWVAVTAIAATLKRHCFIGRGNFKLYPNLFTVLVGHPGIGKGSAINPVLSILRDANVVNQLSDRITIEFMLDRLAKGWNSISPGTLPGSITVGIDHSVLIISRELSVFTSASQFTTQILTDLWDSNEGEYIYGTRHKGELRIDSPCVCLLGGSTQEWLINSIPSDAVGGGFTRRVNFVVENTRSKLIPWPVVSNHSNIRDNLIEDLKEVSKLNGEFKFHTEAVPLFEVVYKDSEPSMYDDMATTSYKTSKWAQVSKIAMCFSASRGDDMIISKKDFENATELVNSVAKNIPRVFRAVGESDLSNVTGKVLDFIETKGFASFQELLRALWRDVAIDDLYKIILTLKEGHIIYEVTQGRKVMYAIVEEKKVP